jgi:C-terminal processing protease CtpA/Prc
MTMRDAKAYGLNKACAPKIGAWVLTGVVVTGIYSVVVVPSATASDVRLTAGVQKALVEEPGVVGLDIGILVWAYPVVRQVFAGSPAEEAGMRPGDQIVAIDGVPALAMTRSQVDEAISDVPGTPVHFKIQRDGAFYKTTVEVTSMSYLSNRLKRQFASAAQQGETSHYDESRDWARNW